VERAVSVAELVEVFCGNPECRNWRRVGRRQKVGEVKQPVREDVVVRLHCRACGRIEEHVISAAG
jgi:hypothetical protein